ncbi:uncharacterized protein TNCV_3280831 [Trichonephila clavipes]|nr:uncharacterized protein TNCV_3280831 [Trichonephila clavipes]
MLKDYTDEGNVVLSCRSSANPAAFNFSWFRNNDSIFSETRENNRQESIIALSGSNPNVYGKYSCIAANDIGASDPCSLDLTALPCEYCSMLHDEAHFWLNGYVNKQNCRIWSEANPQVYVETPLHPEKLTVWCALWAGGILLQKR